MSYVGVHARGVCFNAAMGVRRYAVDPIKRRWQERFDALQQRCHADYYSPAIGDLVDHGIAWAQRRCNQCCSHAPTK